MRRLLSLLVLCACAKEPPEPPRFPKTLAAAHGPAPAAEPPKKPYLPGKVVPVWLQRSMVADPILEALPVERRASNDDDAAALARLDCRSEPMGAYSDGVPAYRSACVVTVVDLMSGAPTARRTIHGNVPPQMRAEEGRFSSVTPPDYAAIAAWLAGLPPR